MKLNYREIYYISEPQNLIPNNRNIVLGTKIDKKPIKLFLKTYILLLHQQFKSKSKLIILTTQPVKIFKQRTLWWTNLTLVTPGFLKLCNTMGGD